MPTLRMDRHWEKSLDGRLVEVLEYAVVQWGFSLVELVVLVASHQATLV